MMRNGIAACGTGLLLFLMPPAWGTELPSDGEEDATGRLLSPSVQMDAAQREALGQTICGAPLQDLDEGGIGCEECPSYTAEPSQSEGLSINNLLSGHFTGAGVSELLLDTDGCESHAEGFGGGLLLRRVGQDWRRLFYQSSVRLDDCLVFPGKDRDRLVCNEHNAGQGTVLGTVSEMRVTPRSIERRPLLRWADNLSSASRDLISALPQAIEALDVDGDGRADLRVRMELFRVRLPKGVGDLEQAREQGLPVPKTTIAIFDFLQGADGFSPAEGSRAGLREVDGMVARLME